MSTPLISVALCTYNGEHYLATQLDSLQKQDYPNLEIVVVDDGSRDGTAELIRSYADPRIHLHINTQNLGFTRNFEKACGLCRGDYIAPCDQDDLWDPRKLSLLATAIEGHVLAYCDSEFMDAQGRSMGERVSNKYRMYSGNDPAAFVFTNCISGHALLARREVIQRAMPFPTHMFHDWWIAFVAASIGSITYVDQPLVKYRQHAQAQTNLSGTAQNPQPKRDHLKSKLAIIERVTAMKGFEPSPHQAYFGALHEALLEWRDHYISPSLYRLLRQREACVFPNDGPARRRLRTLQYYWGLKLKQRLTPGKYAASG